MHVVIRYKTPQADQVWYVRSFYSGLRFKVAYVTPKKEMAAQYTPEKAAEIIANTIGRRSLTTESVTL